MTSELLIMMLSRQFMPVQLKPSSGSDFDLIHVHVFVVQCKMMMRLGSQRNKRRLLCGDRQGKTAHPK